MQPNNAPFLGARAPATPDITIAALVNVEVDKFDLYSNEHLNKVELYSNEHSNKVIYLN